MEIIYFILNIILLSLILYIRIYFCKTINVCINALYFEKQFVNLINKFYKKFKKRTYKFKIFQKELIPVKSLKTFSQRSSVNDFIVINIPEEDVEPIQIILDLDDQPMWESAKTVAPTPNSPIIRPDVDENFVINSTHLKMILENKYDGCLQADPHDHIREFLAICDMFNYGETQCEAVKLFIFPYSLSDKAKTWFNKLTKDSITSWEQMRRVFINRFFPPLLFNHLLLEIRNFSQNECESLTDAWLRLKNMLRNCHGHGLTKGAIIHIFYHGLDEPTQGVLDGTTGGIFLYKTPIKPFNFLMIKPFSNLIGPLDLKTILIKNLFLSLMVTNTMSSEMETLLKVP